MDSPDLKQVLTNETYISKASRMSAVLDSDFENVVSETNKFEEVVEEYKQTAGRHQFAKMIRNIGANKRTD